MIAKSREHGSQTIVHIIYHGRPERHTIYRGRPERNTIYLGRPERHTIYLGRPERHTIYHGRLKLTLMASAGPRACTQPIRTYRVHHTHTGRHTYREAYLQGGTLTGTYTHRGADLQGGTLVWHAKPTECATSARWAALAWLASFAWCATLTRCATLVTGHTHGGRSQPRACSQGLMQSAAAA